VKVFVDPPQREVFSYQAQIVPGNRVLFRALAQSQREPLPHF